jgi:hypothetical protein
VFRRKQKENLYDLTLGKISLKGHKNLGIKGNFDELATLRTFSEHGDSCL